MADQRGKRERGRRVCVCVWCLRSAAADAAAAVQSVHSYAGRRAGKLIGGFTSARCRHDSGVGGGKERGGGGARKEVLEWEAGEGGDGGLMLFTWDFFVLRFPFAVVLLFPEKWTDTLDVLLPATCTDLQGFSPFVCWCVPVPSNRSPPPTNTTANAHHALQARGGGGEG